MLLFETRNTHFGKFHAKNKNFHFKLKLGISTYLNMQNSMVVCTFLFRLEISFSCQIWYKNQTSKVGLFFSALDRKCPFQSKFCPIYQNLGKKLKRIEELGRSCNRKRVRFTVLKWSFTWDLIWNCWLCSCKIWIYENTVTS